MLIVMERRETFHYYYPMGVHPPGDLTVTLHRIEEVELNIEDGRWQSALALALTLPDICGGIAFPV